MGSLPNLHELARADGAQLRPIKCQVGPPLRLSCHGNHHHQLHHTRSAGHAAHAQLRTQGAALWDEFMADHMVGYSPISSRSTRSTLTSHHVILPPLRRRDSLSSSCGASSVRRLIAVVRSTPSRLGPTYSRRVLLRTFTALCAAHAAFTAAFLPLQALQASISAWFWSHDTTTLNPSFPPTADGHQLHQYQPNNSFGSLLFAMLYVFAAITSLLSPSVVAKLGTNCVLLLGYSCAALFFGLHLYPVVLALIPAYVLMGVWLGMLTGARVASLMTLADKLTYCVGDDDDGEEEGGKREIAQRLSRAMQAAQDFGMVMGNAGAALLLWFTLNKHNASTGEDYSLLGALFAETERGERVCGHEACPLADTILISLPANLSVDDANPVVLPCRTTSLLACVAVGCLVMGVAVTAVLMEKIKPCSYQELPERRGTSIAALRMMKDAFRDPKLQLAAPLAVFIGLEQGFMYADFSKYYVMCSLGVPNISLVFLSMGLLQSVAGFTLSMLLQHIRRYLAIGVGFVFHSCLLLVLFVWKPSGDDPALFYVISAAWGVCNAIWETLVFTLVIMVFPHNWQAPAAHGYFFRYLGLSLAFALHGVLCNATKLCILAATLLLAVVPYTFLETRLESRRRGLSHAL